MIDLFGHLPVQERQWVQHVVAVPGGGSAYTLNNIIVYQGNVGTPSNFQHETTYAKDFDEKDDTIGDFSRTDAW
jgi:hypothetical protein